MSVSRTVIFLSGRDPETGTHELYSVNFGYGVCDRTWRRRDLSRFGVTPLSDMDVEKGTFDSLDNVDAPNVVFPQTLHVREDMNITLRGTDLARRGVVRGVWSQTYLPASCEQVPSKEEHARANASLTSREKPQKPEKSFGHPWRFWSDAAFRLADRFSHLGVYTSVDERVQYYGIDVLDELPLEDSGIVPAHPPHSKTSTPRALPALPIINRLTIQNPELHVRAGPRRRLLSGPVPACPISAKASRMSVATARRRRARTSVRARR
jgi:hypothetical protein